MYFGNMNLKKLSPRIEKNYTRVVQFEITGRGAGTFFVRFSPEKIEVIPESYPNPDATVSASFDHLMGMATGDLNADRLFMSGQMKVTGNISKGAELRRLLMPHKQRQNRSSKK